MNGRLPLETSMQRTLNASELSGDPSRVAKLPSFRDFLKPRSNSLLPREQRRLCLSERGECDRLAFAIDETPRNVYEQMQIHSAGCNPTTKTQARLNSCTAVVVIVVVLAEFVRCRKLQWVPCLY